ncbi:sensor histidine kinase [Halalkalibacter wakoensis JCM 9140]|uniref:histidine kinase n=1 Tax=Halalkalibacter wakoensis JCM 9140 TaxID=1236970 RepID=W4Q2X8_9BACI|nr:MASE3 domain-containing protein [Halalkalibacter wakoensis]GAE26073.1 sensor histidine kinase [Halalkalibacter wakoensis JCM 9140]
MQFEKSERNSILLVAVGIFLFLLVFFQGIETNLYHLADHLFVHTVFELISIGISFSIFLYGWLTFPYSKSRLLLLVSLAFLVVAILDIFHTFSYPGMPFAIADHLQTTAWFWLAARLTEALVLILGILFLRLHSPVKNGRETFIWVLATFVISICFPYLILQFIDQLPLLLTDVGPTPLKNGIEYFIAFLHVIAILTIWKEYKKTRTLFHLNLLRACYFLILCGLTLTVFSTVYDFTVIVGHVFKVCGYFFIMKAFYYANIKVPFESKKRTEEKLHEVEHELDLLFDHTEDAILVCNLSTRKVVRTNPAFKKMFGYTNDDMLEIGELIPLKRKDEFSYVYKELRAGRSVVNFKTIRQRKDLTMIDVSMTISPMKDKDHEFLCSVIMRDISEQQRADRELQKARRELQETLEQYQGVIFKFKKEEEQFLYSLIDGKLFRKDGRIPELVVGRSVQEFHPISTSDFDKEMFDVQNKKAWDGEGVEFQFEDGENSVFHVTLKPIKQEDQVIEVIGNVVDITKLIRTEELLRKSEKLSVVGELAAGFAHEIRNPLTTIKGFLQLIELEDNGSNIPYVTIMQNEIVRLEMITNEFMVVAKPQVSSYQMEDIQSVTEDVIHFLNPQALLQSIEMKTFIQENIPSLYCDKHQLQQVLINIYKNAMEAMNKAGTITTDLSIVEDCVRISITDQGCGIPENLISKLGEPFYTLKEKGTGLGLMVSKKIIESHQGTLHIKSETNVGTTMTIELPLTFERY